MSQYHGKIHLFHIFVDRIIWAVDNNLTYSTDVIEDLIANKQLVPWLEKECKERINTHIDFSPFHDKPSVDYIHNCFNEAYMGNSPSRNGYKNGLCYLLVLANFFIFSLTTGQLDD